MPDRIPVRNTRTGGLDHIEVPTRDEALVAALKRERAGYITRGLPERAAAVDAELARLGHTTEVPSDGQERRDEGKSRGRQGAAGGR